MWRRVNMYFPISCHVFWVLFFFLSDGLVFFFFSPSMLNSPPLGEELSCFLSLPCRILPVLWSHWDFDGSLVHGAFLPSAGQFPGQLMFQIYLLTNCRRGFRAASVGCRV